MASRSTNTQAEALQRLLGDIADMKTYPDADLEWLIGLETTILQKLREPVAAAMSQSDMGQMSGQSQAPPMAPPPGAAPPGVPGLRQGPGAPNPDELRRLLTQGG